MRLSTLAVRPGRAQEGRVLLMLLTATLATLGFGGRPAIADNWTMSITVDNFYTIYFGDQSLATPTLVGGDGDWPTTETWNINGVATTDFLYVATASDQAVAQGFLGVFSNLTTGFTFVTSDNPGTPWEVFPAGDFLTQLNAINPTIPAGVWPAGSQPTVSQVQTAVAYATNNNLWVAPNSAPNYTNGDNPGPWGTRPSIPGTAEWIWYDGGSVPAGTYPVPFEGGNQDEFLVFRVAGVPVPEPSTLMLSILLAAGWCCRRVPE